ncbi:MAG: 23S rRNA (adenine(2503)-C(2))-methyltransferase RlmN [Chlamydiae bacterium]|jgi:23S rRNA (adenine2503-C2)-methyltransferase|nr:23S rRNA (adenine(2503)-C(2))-methyltransferase RlmN [Chlamydiota bacterium]
MEWTSLLFEEISILLQEAGQPSFRAKQLTEWLYQKAILDPTKMTNFSASLKDLLQSLGTFSLLEPVKVQESDDLETWKFLWKLQDGSLLESVLICSEKRRTVCVSSQVGCPARCAFCASGKLGLKRNLTTGEIVEQVLRIENFLHEKGESVNHIVYMGMGEPLENFDAVVKSLRILTDPKLFGLSQRHITLSTVGVIEGIRKLSLESFKINLALSLHAPNQNIRKKIIPYARKYDFNELMDAVDEYREITKRDITYEYTLISGINDGVEHAEELGKLLQFKHCTVNLIPYNPVAGLKLEKPDRGNISAFRDVLDEYEIAHTCRYTKGDDIAAACGQLALQETVC